jgi:DNA-binding NarL/FixJ family response regulator
MKSELRILIADDHPIVRQGLRQAIEAEPGLTVVGEAGDGHAALERIQALQPEIAVLDIDMPGADGLAVAREIRARKLSVELIFLTIHREEDLLDEALSLDVKYLHARHGGDLEPGHLHHPQRLPVPKQHSLERQRSGLSGAAQSPG